MRRRGVGVGRGGGRGRGGKSTAGSSGAPSQFQKKADEMKAVSYQSAIDTIEKLEAKLSDFAKTHADEIKNDPAIRQKFLLMCGPLGIDPLLSNNNPNNNSRKKDNIWNSLFFGTSSDSSSTSSSSKNNMGDFYYELAVQVAEICLASRSRNGGIMSITEIQHKLDTKKTRFHLLEERNSGRSSDSSDNPKYSITDLQMAISKLSKLGGGFRMIEIGGDDDDDDNNSSSTRTNMDYANNSIMSSSTSTNNSSSSSSSSKIKDFIQKYKRNKQHNKNDINNNKTYMVISVPIEFDNDHMELLSLVKEVFTQGITVDQIKDATGWNKERIERSLQLLLSKGMIWLDHYQGIDTYWFPSLWQEQIQQEQE